ncbi:MULTISPECIES: Asp-tRNA(Asn)/Glu-tRNA(Gln) amidotransferase subunit GatC [Polyangium]|uniref:Aspartyl/glutamyl-tRNA(Asn/Gln) amidotransferase subunit C n=2 Tax=Polyangium TaxID=55 RepID=A0A4U1ILD8_9BACT|nr:MULTISPECIES: Asp-tRNA(Asn)/Glu-tRNA(Gln) amidotransferase subunit GatC [Polyangium]MDI1436974.1 Asp-tRNA(Asn)/Glu-tRNA(Gln) amidotransferase subunit GatC [Polyangium sorediatum]TKC94659.1 aspartyl/glutamyl-tRNA amidotransferase subunit C [Polyangium fumosum]
MSPAPEGPPPLAEDEVRSLARLANLDLPDDEIRRLTGDLGRILAYVRQLEELDVTGIEPTAQVVPGFGAEGAAGRPGAPSVEPTRVELRADEPHESLPHEIALREAPRTSMDGFAVPGFVEED